MRCAVVRRSSAPLRDSTGHRLVPTHRLEICLHALVAVYGLDSTPLTAVVRDLAPSVVQAKPRP